VSIRSLSQRPCRTSRNLNASISNNPYGHLFFDLAVLSPLVMVGFVRVHEGDPTAILCRTAVATAQRETEPIMAPGQNLRP
jgi:hypothetical protein